jgi:hypothetical protein
VKAGIMRRALILVSAAISMCPLTQAFAQAARAQAPRLNTLQDVGRALWACWVPPPPEKSRPGTRITIWVTFRRDGEVMGEPKFTYVTPGLPQEVRVAYERSVADAVSRCSHLPFTPALGDAVAGHPFAMQYQDPRGLKGA